MYALPLVARILRPVATTAVRLGYYADASVNDMLADARRQVQGISSMPNQRIRRGSAHRSDPPIWVGAEIIMSAMRRTPLLHSRFVGEIIRSIAVGF